MEGNIYASCSKDGAIKLWDGVSNLAVNTIPNAHNGAEVFNLPRDPRVNSVLGDVSSVYKEPEVFVIVW